MVPDPDNVVPDTGAESYKPTSSEVARLLRARTKDSNGVELGDWSEDTRPTTPEVNDLIDQAVGDVLAQLGPLHLTPPGAPGDPPPPVTLDDLVAPAARTLVTLRAAMLVELSYFPEQVAGSRSAYEEYKRLYDDGLDSLVGEDGSGGGGVVGRSYSSGTTRTPNAPGASGSVWPEPENPNNWPDPLTPPHSAVGDEPASGRRYPIPDSELRVGHPWPEQ